LIKFFRPIRQRMIKENPSSAEASAGKRVSKYLLYAFGEVVLVVIGILIALQLNLMKEENNVRKQEVQTLEQLHDEFTSNLVQLDKKIAMRKIMMKAGLQLLAYHDDNTLIVQDSVELCIARTTVCPTFDPVTNDLITSGRLHLISNPSLRRMLSSWTSEVVQVTEEEQAWIEKRRKNYDPFLSAHYPMRNIQVVKWSGLDVIRTIMLNDKNAVNGDIGRSKRQPDLQAFFAQPELEEQLSHVVSASLFANRQSESLRESIVQILELIDTELKNEQ